MTGYNYSTIVFEDAEADSIAVKSPSSNVKIYNLINGKVQVNTNDYLPDEYNIQYFRGDQVIKQDVLTIKQNLKHAPDSYNPQSKAKQILTAINAYLSGIATHQQRKVKVGEKEIEYSSFDELIKWKNFYEKLVLKESGKPTQIRHEKLFFRGV